MFQIFYSRRNVISNLLFNIIVVPYSCRARSAAMITRDDKVITRIACFLPRALSCRSSSLAVCTSKPLSSSQRKMYEQKEMGGRSATEWEIMERLLWLGLRG